MAKEEYPITTAVRFMREHNMTFKPFVYRYEEHGGTHQFSEEYHVSEHMVVKTLIFETETKQPLIVLMHGDREVSTKQLARLLNVKQITPCDANTATKHTGYQFGGTSPFGTRHPLPLYVEKTILELPKIYINGGKRGFIVEMDPHELGRVFPLTEVSAAISS